MKRSLPLVVLPELSFLYKLKRKLTFLAAPGGAKLRSAANLT